MGNFTESEKTQYTYWILEYMASSTHEVLAAKFWAELLIKGQVTWGEVVSPKRLATAMRLIELGRADLVPTDYLVENGLA